MKTKGQAAVEFALIAPMIALTMLAFMDFGRALIINSRVLEALYAGATYAGTRTYPWASSLSEEQLERTKMLEETARRANVVLAFHGLPQTATASFGLERQVPGLRREFVAVKATVPNTMFLTKLFAMLGTKAPEISQTVIALGNVQYALGSPIPRPGPRS